MTFQIRKPTADQIKGLLTGQSNADFTYPMIKCTRDRDAHRQSFPGYAMDHNRIKLGSGRDCFAKATAAIRQWQMFNLGWVEVASSAAPIEVGTLACVVAQSLYLWSINVCRIVYVLDEIDSEMDRFGFGYGTLSAHIERGEERFCVEYHHEDESVWYDLLAYSQPNKLIAKVGYPVVRQFQKRFARDSKRAMVDATNG